MSSGIKLLLFAPLFQCLYLYLTTIAVTHSSPPGGPDQIYIDVISGFGGDSEDNGILPTGGIEGKWIIFSISGGTLPPGYHQLIVLVVESLAAKSCDPANFVLTNGVVSDSDVRWKRLP